jgi:tetratricopeptide (TPR) repeat protein
VKFVQTLLCAGLLIVSFQLACASSQYKQAVEFREAGKQEEGIAYFRQKLNTESGALDLFDAHRLILQYHDDLDRLDEGFALYDGFTDFALTNYIQGLRNQYDSLHTQAVENFKAALEVRPKEYAIWYDLAVSYMRMGPKYYREARGALARVYNLNSGFAPAQHDMALMYGFGRGAPAAGMSWMLEAVNKYYPAEKATLADAKITLALFAAQCGEFTKARDAYRSLGDEYFEKAVRAGDPGEAYFRTGDKVRALSAWQKALDVLGYQSSRGRHFFKQLYGSRQGRVDFTGIKFQYATIESLQSPVPRYVYAAESEPVYDTNHKVSFERLQNDGLDDLKMGYETWTVEYLGISTAPRNVRRPIQNRGIKKSLATKDGLHVFASVQKSRLPVPVPDKDEPGRMKNAEFWREGNTIIAIYEGEEQRARYQLPFAHFHDFVLQDVDGDGKEDIVACGFDVAGNLQIDVRVRAEDSWRLLTQQTCDLQNPHNGFVLLDLDGEPGLELVSFTTLIGWADVYQRTPGGFVKNNALFTKFAEDFAWRYSFLDQAQINQRLASPRISAEEKAALPLLLQYRYTAEGIARSAQP